MQQQVPLTFNRHVIKLLLGHPLSWHDLAFMDPQRYEILRGLLVSSQSKDAVERDSIEDLCLTFVYEASVEEGGHSIELVPNGSDILVTAANTLSYVHFYARAKLNRCAPACAYMQRGMHSVIDALALDLLTAEDFWLLLNGQGFGHITVEDLKHITEFRDRRDQDDQARSLNEFVEMYWQCLSQLTDSELQKFLYFCIGASRLSAIPHRQQANLLVDVKTASLALPRVQSCFRKMDIPFYDDSDTMLAKLRMALTVESFDLE